LANFLSISSNQTKLLLFVCLIPELDFFAIPVSISAVSLGRLSTYILFFYLRLLNGQFSSETFFKSFSGTANMFISIFMIQIQTANFLVILAETACWVIERK
jgi:hypothetical protein